MGGGEGGGGGKRWEEGKEVRRGRRLGEGRKGREGEEEEWEREGLNIYIACPKCPSPLALLVERNVSPPLQWVESSGEERVSPPHMYKVIIISQVGDHIFCIDSPPRL